MLEPGQRLAHYRIQKRLGAGGMGEVWEAEDTRLDRRVALKMLSPELAGSQEQLERLRREARALARLQHPGIVTVHAFEEVDGIRFVAMELVEGERLSRRISRGPIPLKEFFRLAIPLVDTIAAAHAQGVIHRDLKPGNIMVDRRGRIKVLDFGLAKRSAADEASSDQTEALTQDGRLLGTLPYMSPEQIHGREPDFRSDIFATGLVLYELLTGHYPFNKESQAGLISSILRDEPVPLTEARPELPRQLGTIVRRCLEKDPEQRFQTAIDLRNALEDLDEDLTSDEILERSRGLVQPARPPGRRRRAVQLLAAGGLVIAAALLWRLVPTSGEEEPQPVTTPIVTWPSSEAGSRLSPDGAWVSFLSDRTDQQTVWLQDLAGGRARRLTDHEGEIWGHVWAPDSRRLAVLLRLSNETLLQTVSFAGGPVETSRKLDAEFADAELVRWLGDNLYLEVPGSGLWRLDLESGDSERLMPQEAESGTRSHFDVDPSGRRVLYRLLEAGRSSVWSARIDGSGATRLSAEGFAALTPHWIGDDANSFVFSSNRGGESDLWLTRISGRASRRLNSSESAQYIEDVRPDGRMLSFSRVDVASDLWTLDPETGNLRQLTADRLRDRWPSGSRAARAVAFQRSKPRPGTLPNLFNGEILLARFVDGRLTAEEPVAADGFLPSLAPDGRSLAFGRRGEERSYELWLTDLGSGHSVLLSSRLSLPPMQMEQLDPVSQNTTWSPDGGTLFFVAVDEERRPRLYRHSLSSGETRAIAGVDAPTPARARDLFVSPDGGSLAWLSIAGAAPARAEIRILDLEAETERTLLAGELGDGEGLHLRGWLAGGRSLLALRSQANPDWSHRLRLLEIGADGTTRELATLARALVGTARLQAASDTLYVTLLEEDGRLHNLSAVALDSGEIRALTDNRIAGVRFSAVEEVADGVLLFTRHLHNSDVFTVSLGNPNRRRE